jgi:hypothetical protein
MLPFDLHVLSMPPAFNLSQDQTLQFNSRLSVFLLTSIVLTSLFLKHSKHFQSAHTVCLLYLLNERCPEGVLRILRISCSLSNTFFNYFK